MKKCAVLLAVYSMVFLAKLGLTPALGAEVPGGPGVLMLPPPPAPVTFTNQVWTPLQLALFPPVEIPNINCKVCGLSLGLFAVGGMYDTDVIGLQIGGLMAFTKEMYGIKVAGLWSLNRDSLGGLQVSGLGNFTGDLPCGLQLACIGNFVTRDMGCGLQIAGALNRCESGAGLQVALMNEADHSFKGIQVGVLNRGPWNSGWHEVVTPGGGKYYIRTPPYPEGVPDMRGLQLGFWNQAKASQGFQIGAFNLADTMAGLQLGLLNLPVKTMTGLQIGFLNNADTLTGVQLGVFNGAAKLTGLQIGLLNVIQERPVPFLPLLNAHF
jgi:hypothetical protein